MPTMPTMTPVTTVTPRLLVVPGLWNSGPKHWQSQWEANDPSVVRVVQRDWETPRREDWVAAVEEAVARTGPEIVLAAHSLGCATLAFWALETRLRARGLLLVAPSDTEASKYPNGPVGFAPMPLRRLPFPSIVVTSSNDEYVTPERARAFASAWGAELIDAGALGHINSDSDLGVWPLGQQLVERLAKGTTDRLGHRRLEPR